VGAEEKDISIVITGNLGGIYFPFDGKHPDEMREVESTLAKLRKKEPSGLFIDTGEFSRPAFFNETSYTAAPVRIFKEVKYDAINLGENEVLLGKSFLEEWNRYLSPIFLSNVRELKTGQHIVEPYRILERSNVKIGIVAGCDIRLEGFISTLPGSPKNVLQDLQIILKKIRNQVDFIILVTDRGDNAIQNLIQQEHVSLIIHTVPSNSTDTTVTQVSGSLICHRQNVFSIGRLSITYDTTKKQIIKHKYKEQKIDFIEPDINKYTPWQPDSKLIVDIDEKMKSYIPEIGIEIEDVSILKKLGPKIELLEMIQSTIDVQGVMKGNKKVFAYMLDKNDKPVNRLYYCGYRAGYGGPAFFFHIAFSPQGEVTYFRPTSNAILCGNTLNMTRFYSSLQRKSLKQWKQPPFSRGITGFYQKLFVNCVRAVDAVNNVLMKEHPF
jgi:2',3'-cyclic-nucleotide 2'-phosphodiesterase (5'-nucleotidase family)